MYKELDIDYTDKSLFEEVDFLKLQEEKDFYTLEEAYELIMSGIKSIYELKDAV